MWFNGKHTKAHRISWLIHNGKIPEGKSVLHTCDVPLCVNPAHLYLGTEKENGWDRAVRSRMPSKITSKEALDIFNSKISLMKTANKYRISKKSVLLIKQKKNWRWIHGS